MKNKTTKRYVLLANACLTAFILISACTPKSVVVEEPTLRPAEPTRTKQIEPEARPLYFQAERAFSAKNYELAQKLFTQVKTKYPRGRAYAFAAYRLGVIHYFREEYPSASKEFETFVTRIPQSDLSFDATYNWAASEFQLGRYERANQILARLKPSDIQLQGPRRAETVYQLSARVSESLGNYPGVIKAHSLELQLPVEEKIREALVARVDASLEKISSKPILEQLLTDVTEPITHAKISSRITAITVVETVPSSAPSAVGAAGEVPPPPLVPGEALSGTEGNVPPRMELPQGGSYGDRINIGVALPLTGRWATYGRRALDGILLASRVYGSTPGPEIHLFIEDTASNPLIAQNAVDELFYKHDVMAIIGPLNWKESLAVAERSAQLGVLNLSLSSKEGISDKGPYLFQNALTPRVQLESLVRFCTTEKQFKRFAILAPNNGFGKDMTKQFWDLVDQYGGRVVAYHQYPPEEKDFQSYIREMAGLSDMKYRRLESAKLADYLKDQKTKTGKEPKAQQLAGIVDFDAIFIPDSPKTVAQIAPSLAYFDVTNVTLLGTTEWNSEQFYRRGGKYVEAAVFPAGLNLNSRNQGTRNFIKKYEEAYGSSPDLLSAQAYEALDLISSALRNTGSADRNVLVNALANTKDFETPLGNVNFEGDRTARRRLSILTLDENGNLTEH